MTSHRVGTREQWLAERVELLEAEKEHTRQGDELARRRRDLPCIGCSFTADSIDGAVFHLANHGVTFVAVSRAPLAKLRDYHARSGWSFPWVSAGGNDFNLDFSVFTEEGRRTGQGFNFGTARHADIDLRTFELHGLSAFALEDGVVYHTYSTYDRGTDGLNATWQLLDRTPRGRDGAPDDWPRRRADSA